MTELYKKIEIPNFDIQQQELIKLVENKFLDTNRLDYYDPSTAEMTECCPSLYTYILEKSKVPIRFFRIYHSPPGGGLGPHIDGGAYYRSPIGLNLPILNCTNSLMKWWDKSNAKMITGNFGWNGIPAVKILNKPELQCIDQVEIDVPTFVRTDFIHSVENYNYKSRIIMSIRWKFDRVQGQQFQDVFEL